MGFISLAELKFVGSNSFAIEYDTAFFTTDYNSAPVKFFVIPAISSKLTCLSR